MQMTVMSEGLLLNSNYNKMGREEGGFSSFPLVIVCHELIIQRAVIHLRLCDGLKCRCSISCQAKSVSNSCQANLHLLT